VGQNLCLNLKTGAVSQTGAYDRDVRQRLDVRLDADWQDREKTFGTELRVYDDKTGSALWKKRFRKDPPVISQEEPGVLVFFWGMEGETAWDEIAHSSLLTKTADETHEEHQGVLTELVDSHSGAVLRQVMSPEGANSGWGKEPGLYVSGEKDKRFARVYGNLVAVHGNESNTVVYDAKTGTRLMAFWGQPIAGSSELGLLAATNHDQEVVVYDVGTGKELSNVMVDHPVTAAQFVAAKKQLLIVTSGQMVYTLDVSGARGPSISQTAQAVGAAKP